MTIDTLKQARDALKIAEEIAAHEYYELPEVTSALIAVNAEIARLESEEEKYSEIAA